MKKLNWEIIWTMIGLAIFWLTLIFLLGSCVPINQDRENRQDSLINVLQQKDTAIIYKPDTMLYNEIVKLQGQIITLDSNLGKSHSKIVNNIINADSNVRMAYFALKDNQQQLLNNQIIFTKILFEVDSSVYLIKEIINEQQLRCWLDCKNNFTLTDSTNCPEILELLEDFINQNN